MNKYYTVANINFLESERLELIPVNESHVTERYLGWLNDQEVTKYLESGRLPYSMGKLKQYVEEQMKRPIIFLAIHEKADGSQIGNIKSDSTHIGNIKIDAFKAMHLRAEYGIMIGDRSAWGKGYAEEASRLVIQHCFDRINLRKITLGVVADNEAAVKVYRDKLNFRQEGLMKAHQYCDGAYRDVLRMATFKEQWLPAND